MNAIAAKGFTIIELVLVIVLIAIIAIYAAPQFNKRDFDVAEAAGEVVEAIRYTQSLAMQHSGKWLDTDNNQDYYRFQISGNNYSVSLVDSDTVNEVVNPVTGASNYTQSWSSGIKLSTTTTDIFFNSRGEPVNSSGVTLSEVTITVSDSSDSVSQRITVEQLTGYTHQ